jgi:DNA-binding LytR/AlgR family response regulator
MKHHSIDNPLDQIGDDVLQNLQEEHFFVNAEYSLVKVKYADILYIEGLKDYIKIYVSTQPRPIITC